MKYLNVIEWEEEQVAAWLRDRDFNSLCETFVSRQITGTKLLQLTERHLKCLVIHGILRKRLWRDLRTLMQSLDYSNSEAEQTAASLEDTSSDLLIYTHRLVTAGLITQNIEQIENVADRLREVGIENRLHLLKIKEAFEKEKNKLRSKIPLHITYHRKSQTLASLVDIYLKLRGFRTTKSQDSSSKESLLVCECLVVVLDSHIDQSVEDNIQLAINNGLKVLLVVDERLNLNEGHLNLSGVEVVRWVHDYQEAAILKIERYVTHRGQRNHDNLMKTRSISVDSGIDICA